MNKIKVIKTEEDYKEALEMVSALIDLSPEPESEDGEKLNLLATLIEDYEAKIFPETLPDPIDAILFRMEQANLKPADLIPYIGSRSKVSEILSRKRPLTLSMMRALQTGLGIPAKVLLQEADNFRDENAISWEQFPIKEMEERGYFPKGAVQKSTAQKILEKFFAPIGSPTFALGMTRKTNYRGSRPMDQRALVAWSCYILKKGLELKYPTVFKKEFINTEFMRNLVRLSIDEQGPLKAIDYLKKVGIGLIIERHFPKTYLDGAVIMTNKDHPVIGLTLRYDRLDNFWFTLMHEVAHIALHYDKDINLFFDDLDNGDINAIEKEADDLAGEMLIPKIKWENSPAKLIPSPVAAAGLAKEIGVHPAIIAGKMRRDGDRYQYLNTIINQATVRNYFPKINWK